MFVMLSRDLQVNVVLCLGLVCLPHVRFEVKINI